MIFDRTDHPEAFSRLAAGCTSLLVGLVREQHGITGPFAGGYLMIEQLGLWVDRIARLKEDASALFSPNLYVGFFSPKTPGWPKPFPKCAIHLSFLIPFSRGPDPRRGGAPLHPDQQGRGEDSGPRDDSLFQKSPSPRPLSSRRGKLDLEDLRLLRSHLSPEGALPPGRRREVRRDPGPSGVLDLGRESLRFLKSGQTP